ncbi:outer membrane porin, OprD family, partial [Pseudomonas donghuensis]|nr:outer membrane porin, OprD family [Pseudomonas donghuensis]
MFAPFPLAPGRRVAGLFLLCAGVNAQAAGFLEDSSAKIEARNVYFNRDFRDG